VDEFGYKLFNGRKLAIALLLCCALVLATFPMYLGPTCPGPNICINNLRQLDGAIMLWTLEYQKNWDKVTMSDLMPYLGQELQCPEGGKYSIGPAVSNGVTCSFPSHELPW
jgi:hypothetical protein